MIENTPVAAETAVTAAAQLDTLQAFLPPDEVQIIGVMIPIIAIVLGIGTGMLALWLDYRKKREFFELHHKERMAAIEKGMEVPALPAEFFEGARKRPKTPGDYLRRGLVWLFVGLAITFAMWAAGDDGAFWGLVPAAVGAAYLLFYFTEGQRAPREEKRHE